MEKSKSVNDSIFFTPNDEVVLTSSMESTSVNDLEKIKKMCEVFGITYDDYLRLSKTSTLDLDA